MTDLTLLGGEGRFERFDDMACRYVLAAPPWLEVELGFLLIAAVTRHVEYYDPSAPMGDGG